MTSVSFRFSFSKIISTPKRTCGNERYVASSMLQNLYEKRRAGGTGTKDQKGFVKIKILRQEVL